MANLLMASRSGGEVSEDRANFFLSIVRGIEPKDPLEAMLAVQMAIIQQTLVEQRPYLLQLQHAGHRADVLAGINKLARTFAMQMDTLKRYRSKGEQKMVVQHVNVSEGGQAIVGDVHQPQKGSAVSPSPALTHSKQQPMQPLDEPAKQKVSAKSKSTR